MVTWYVQAIHLARGVLTINTNGVGSNRSLSVIFFSCPRELQGWCVHYRDIRILVFVDTVVWRQLVGENLELGVSKPADESCKPIDMGWNPA